MDFRNASTLERHTAVLELCERSARNIETTFEKDGDSRFIADSTREIVSKLAYLASRASAGWTAGFHNTLMLAHSIRVVRIDHESKSQLRQKPMRCAACGRFEKNCGLRLDLVGDYDGDYSDPAEFCQSYKSFLSTHSELMECKGLNTLHRFDLGSYTLGKTCLRKSRLAHMANTLMLQKIREFDEKLTQTPDATDLKRLYCVDSDAAVDFEETIQKLQLAVADEKRSIPKLWTDDALFWKLDVLRLAASNGDDILLKRMLRRRAAELMELDSDYSYDSESESSEEPEPVRPRKRRRRVIDSDDEEVQEANTRGNAAKPRRSARLNPPASTSTSAPAPAQIVTVPTPVPAQITSPAPAPAPASAPLAPLGSDAVSLARLQRMPSRLPARRATLIALSSLQSKLLSDGRDDDAAVITNALFTLQEMMKLAQDLAHSTHL